MKIRIELLAFLLLAAIIGCKTKNNPNSSPTAVLPPSFRYQFQVNTQLALKFDTIGTDTLVSQEIVPGNKVVFEYEYSSQNDLSMADDEYYELLRFQVDTNVDSFSFANGNIDSTACRFQSVCFCPTIGAIQPDSGYLQGIRMNDSIWQIKTDLILHLKYHRFIDTNTVETKLLKIDALFKKGNLIHS